MTTRPPSDRRQDSARSRSEIESALSGRTKRNTRKAKRPEVESFDLSVPPRRQQVIGGKLSGVSKRNKFSVFSRYSDISVANWIALFVVGMIIAAFFWPNSKDPTREIDTPEQFTQAQFGETDLTQSEQADLLNSVNDNSELEFSRSSDLDRANSFRDQEIEDLQIRSLLDDAKSHIASAQYVQPVEGNAVKSYKEILLIDPRNIAANQGLQFIEGRFLDIGNIELNKNNLKKAELTLKQLASINTDSDEHQALSDAIKNWKIERQIDSFNELGSKAFARQNYILPAKKNALYYFKQSLELDEKNETAKAGIERVANDFVEQANLAIIANEYQAAAAHLATISIIDPEHKSIKALDTALNRALIIEQKAAERETTLANSAPQQAAPSPSTVNVSQDDSSRTLSRQTLEQQTFDKQYLKEGLEAYYQGDYLKAASLLQPLADKGIARAQFRLAYMYYLGRGFAKDTVTADSMIRAALPAIQKFADGNRPWAQSDLGSLYEDGLVLARDFSKAVGWYRSAAEQGYPGAQTNLGMMYARGRGVSSNRSTAIEWFKKAASQGDNVAKRNLVAMGVNSN
jgi:hypothetical protein